MNSLSCEVARIFKRAGYHVVACEGFQSSFDILAKGEGRLFLVNVLSNIEGLTPKKACELKKVSNILDGVPLIVGARLKSARLDEGVVYERYGIHVVGQETLSQILADSAPKTYTIRGNYCMRLDPKRLSLVRRRHGLTQDRLASILGVSKQSVYRYECEGRVSSLIAERMSEFFGDIDDLFLPSDVFHSEAFSGDREFTGYVSELKRETFDFFRDIGFDASFTKAPFDIVLKDEETVFTTVSNDWRRLKRKIRVVEEISETIGGVGVCITERTKKASGIVLKPEDLKGIKTSKEFIELLS